MARAQGPQLRSELIAALESWGVESALAADGSASLIGSGQIDSVALFGLSMWIEERIGRPVDPASFDVLREWDTVDAILRFIEGGSAGASEPPAQAPAEAAASPPPSPAPVAPAVHTRGPYRIERYSSKYDADVAELQTRLWSPDRALNAAVFHWKYVANPFAADPLIYLAIRDGKAVAMRAFAGTSWEAGGAQAPATLYCADDLVIGEADRAHGLFGLFTEVALEDLSARRQDFFFSLSALRVARLQSLATGSHGVAAMEVIGRRSAVATALDNGAAALEKMPVLWRAGKAVATRNAAAVAFRRLEQRSKRGGDMRFEVRTDAAPAEMAALVARLAYDGRIRHVRDERFFAWRYRHPLHRYRFLLAWHGSALAGYLVLQRGLSAYANPVRVNVVDWEAESPAARAALLDQAIAAGRFDELVTWRSPQDDERARTLQEAGFVATDLEQAARGLPCILIRPVAAQADGAHLTLGTHRVLEGASWDLRMAYTSYA